jgi:hypothetical protein
MPATRPFAAAIALLVCAAVLVGLPATGATGPAFLTSLDGLRIALALPVALFLPGFLLAPLLLPRETVRDGRLDAVTTLLAGAAVNVLLHALHMNALRAAALPIDGTWLGGLQLIEGAVAIAVWKRRGFDPAWTPSAPGPRTLLAVGAICVLIAGMQRLPRFSRDSSWNFYSAAMEAGWEREPDFGALDIGRTWTAGVPFRPTSAELAMTIVNRAPEAQPVPVLFLVHGPLGTEASLAVGDAVVAQERTAASMPFDGFPEPVERYWGWGTAALAAMVDVPSGGDVRVLLRLPKDVDRSRLAVLEWSAYGSPETREELINRGFHAMHPFQLLNVTENVRWADEISTDHALPGRSPDGTSTLHQPPAWTYLYAPMRLLGTPHLASASALFFAILVGLVALASIAVRDTELSAGGGAVIGLAVGATTVQHGRMMVSDGSMNFPDPLFALAIGAAVTLLVTGRTRSFVLWAALAALLRYPGAVVVGIAVVATALLDAAIRRRTVAAAMRFGLGIAVFCGAMLCVALLTGQLESWLFALYFETIPEHFANNPDAMSLAERPVEFLRLFGWLGGALLIAALPLRGTLARVAAATAVGYAPFLAFIDHFSHHYFLPLLALTSIAFAASAARAGSAAGRLLHGAIGAALAGFLLRSAHHMGL